jgi:hypothetical protein
VDYLNERRREFQTTLRVLQSYPDDQVEERILTSLVNNGVADPSLWAIDVPGSMMKIIEMWQDAAAENDGLLATLSREDWGRIVNFY